MLDLLLGGDIDVGGGFIHDDQLVLSKDGSADAKELLLSSRQVVTSFGDFQVESSLLLITFLFLRGLSSVKDVLQPSFFQEIEDLFI